MATVLIHGPMDSSTSETIRLRGALPCAASLSGSEPEDFVAEGIVFVSPSGTRCVHLNGLRGKIGLIEGFTLGDDGFEQTFPVFLEKFFHHGVGACRPDVEHGDEDPIRHIHIVPEFTGGIEEGVDADYRAHTRLHRYDQLVCGDEGVVSQDPENRWAVEDDVLVFVRHPLQGAAEAFFAANAGGEEFGCFGEVRSGRNDVQIRYGGFEYGPEGLGGSLHDEVANVAFGFSFQDTARGMRLGIQID